MPTKPPTFRQHMPSVSSRAMYDATRRKDDPALAEAARIRNGTTWRKVRAHHIAQHPLCVDPFKTHGDWPVPACDVHHIQGLAAAPALAYTPDNLASLCRPCHNRAEALERAGKGTQGLFRPATGGDAKVYSPTQNTERCCRRAILTSDLNRPLHGTKKDT